MINHLIGMLCCHLIGDFYIQSDSMAKNKFLFNKAMIRHSLCYTSIFLIYFIIFCRTNNSWKYIAVIFITHICIDSLLSWLKKNYKNYELSIFVVDQLIHIGIIYLIANDINSIVIYNMEFVTLLFALLLIFKPVGICIDYIFAWIFCERKAKVTLGPKIGSRIGYFERLIIFILCIFNSIGTIGFVIAAKTLVRYKDINANKNDFQEKYLIGTLTSTIGALLCYGLWFYLKTK